MKTLITSNPLSPLITTAIFGALALSAGAVCRAADSADLRQVVVSFRDLNPATRQGATVLYGRIAAAADEVCKSYAADWDPIARARMHACVHKAIADAVIKVGQPELLAIYSARSHLPVPAKVAVAQTR